MKRKIVSIPVEKYKPVENLVTSVTATKVNMQVDKPDIGLLKAQCKRISEAYIQLKVEKYVDEIRIDFTQEGKLLFNRINKNIEEYLKSVGKDKNNIQMEDWRSFDWKTHLPESVNVGSICNKTVFMIWKYQVTK